jgi:hypothetical protein
MCLGFKTLISFHNTPPHLPKVSNGHFADTTHTISPRGWRSPTEYCWGERLSVTQGTWPLLPHPPGNCHQQSVPDLTPAHFTDSQCHLAFIDLSVRRLRNATPWRRTVLEKLTVAQLVEKLATFMVRYPVQTGPPLDPILSQLKPVHHLTSGLFLWGFPTELANLPHAFYMSHSSPSPWFDHLNSSTNYEAPLLHPSTLSSNTPQLCSILMVQYQVSHPHRASRPSG